MPIEKHILAREQNTDCKYAILVGYFVKFITQKGCGHVTTSFSVSYMSLLCAEDYNLSLEPSTLTIL